MHVRRYFWLNREIRQSKYFQYFDQLKKGHDRAKFGLAGHHVRPLFKNYFEPCIHMQCKSLRIQNRFVREAMIYQVNLYWFGTIKCTSVHPLNTISLFY